MFYTLRVIIPGIRLKLCQGFGNPLNSEIFCRQKLKSREQPCPSIKWQITCLRCEFCLNVGVYKSAFYVFGSFHKTDPDASIKEHSDKLCHHLLTQTNHRFGK